MRLLLHFVLHCFLFNIQFKARHVPGPSNEIADALSCLLFNSSEHWPQKQQRCCIRCPLISGSLASWDRQGYTVFFGVTTWGQIIAGNAKLFLQFCAEHGWCTSWPVSVEAVMHFILHLYHSAWAAATISNRLATVSFESKTAGCEHPCSDFRLRKVCKVRPKEAPTLKMPISQLLGWFSLSFFFSAVLSMICSSGYEQLLFKTNFAEYFGD